MYISSMNVRMTLSVLAESKLVYGKYVLVLRALKCLLHTRGSKENDSVNTWKKADKILQSTHVVST